MAIQITTGKPGDGMKYRYRCGLCGRFSSFDLGCSYCLIAGRREPISQPGQPAHPER
jgi:hypothetical protein